MKKRVLATVMGLTMAGVVLTGCSSEKEVQTTVATETSAEGTTAGEAVKENTVAEAPDKISVYMVAKGFQTQYWQAVYSGAKQAAEEFQVDLQYQGPDTETEIAQQVQILNNAIQMKPSVIGLAALDTGSLEDSINRAYENHIPIVGFDSGVPGAKEGAVYANVSTDNYAAGKVAADHTYELIKDTIKNASAPVRIGVTCQDATGESNINRGTGFLDRMTELVEADDKKVAVEGHDKFTEGRNTDTKNADVIMEVKVPTNSTAELAAIDAQTLLNKKDTICIFASNQVSGEGLVKGDENIRRLGKDVVGVAFDSGVIIKGAIKDKKLAGAITQAPVAIGYETVKACVAVAKGEKISDVDTGCKWYDADNMDDPEIAQNLYD